MLENSQRETILFYYKKVKLAQLMQMARCSKTTIYNVVKQKRNDLNYMPKKSTGRRPKLTITQVKVIQN